MSRAPSVSVHDARVAPTAALRTKVAIGVRWGITVSIATQVGKMMFLLALMRLLGPQSYGIVGQATIVIAIAQIFVHFGLAVSIVQRPQIDQSEIGTAFWLNAAMGLLLAVLMLLGAPALAGFFKTEELTAVVRVLSISLVLKAIGIVPTALLTRNMQFRGIALTELSSTFLSGGLGVAAAAAGEG
jgi:O-antigen/teichoic acid export membrane protein